MIGKPFPGSQTLFTQTGADIIENVRSTINESSAAFWSDTEILQWINDGILDIVSKTWCMGATENLTLVNGTNEYLITGNPLVIHTVIYNGEKALLPGSPDNLGHIEDVLEPVYWYEWNGYIGVVPMPNAAVAGNDLKVYSIPQPTALATTAAQVGIPVVYINALEYYVCARAHRKDNNPEEAAAARKNYMGELSRYRSDYNEKASNGQA